MAAGREKEADGSTHARDLALGRQVASGDRAAGRKLASLLMNRVRAVAYSLAGADEEAEDDAQLAMMEILRSVHTYRGDSPIEAWAEQVAVRTVLRSVRQRRWRRSFFVFESRADQCRVRLMSAEDAVFKQRVSERVTALLGELKPDYRAAVVLKMILGYTVEEIVRITGSNRHTVDYRLRKGRGQLRKKLRNDPLLRDWISTKEKTP